MGASFCLSLPMISLLSLQTPQDTVKTIASIDADVARQEALLEREVWPGYHFSQLGVMYVIPGRAKLAAHWPTQPPEGMRPLEGFANIVWTDTGVVRWQGGLPVASLAITPTMSRGLVAGTAMHEAFHAFEVTQRKEGGRFGWGENALLTSRYPAFDVVNEALFSVEAKLLRAAVLAPNAADARNAAQQFLAVRARRQARLDSAFVHFERAAEMHEGMAQYVLVRGLAVLAQQDAKYARSAEEQKKIEGDLLANTLAGSNLSVRRRAYATGSYLGLLLDKLRVNGWKQRVIRDEWVQDILQSAVGTAAVSAETSGLISQAMLPAIEAVNQLRVQRVAMRDSLLNAAALRIVIDPALVGSFDWCGFDPQNLLPTGNGDLLHTRMLNLCSHGERVAGIYQASVQDASGRIQLSVDPATLKLTQNGEDVTLKTNDVDIHFPHAQLLRSDKVVLIVPLAH